MSGDASSSRQLLADKFEKSVGLPGYVHPDPEGAKLLTIPRSELRTMDAVELGEAAVCLQQFAFHLQRSLNREVAELHRLEENVRAIVATEVAVAKGWSYEERQTAVIRRSESGRKLETERVATQGRVDRINYLATRCDALARAMVELQQTKRRRHD